LLAGLSVSQSGASAESANRGTVVVDEMRMDAAVVPVYKYFKAMTTGDFALYHSVFSTNYLKYAMGRDPERRFKQEAEEFLRQDAPIKPLKEFSYRYDESHTPFPMVVYQVPTKAESVKGRVVTSSVYVQGSVYVEKEGTDWKISIPPDQVRKMEESATKRAGQSFPANRASPRLGQDR
jgi:hypothetical protein